MKKLLVILAILLLLGAGYFTYEKWVKHSDLTAWSFVPADAAVVMEFDLMKDLQEIQASPFWQNLASTSGVSKLEQSLTFVDSINGSGGFSAIFKKVPVLVSAHKVASSQLDFLMICEIGKISQNTFINAVIGQFQDQGYRVKARNYNGFSISELSVDETTFTYIFYKNFFLGSFTPYLVEDAIRAVDGDEIDSFFETYAVSSSGKVHVNFEQLSNAIGAFASSSVTIPLASGSFQMTLDSTLLNLSGFANAENTWVGTHSSNPQPFDVASVVPSSTAALYHITGDDLATWDDLNMVFAGEGSPMVRMRDSLESSIDFNVSQVFDLVDGEVALAELEARNLVDEPKMFYLKVKDAGSAIDYFAKLTERIAYARGDTVYTEQYSANEIRFLPIRNFPASLIGGIAEGFDRCFYLNYRNYLIFSNNIQELRSLVSSIESEDTWGKSVQMTAFLDRVSSDANASLFVNVPRFWPRFIDALKPEWKSQFRKDAASYRRIELAAFQVAYTDGNYFTNITLSQSKKRAIPVAKTSADQTVLLANPIVSKPHLVRTHAHNYFEIFVQDSTNSLYFFDQNFAPQWTIPLDEPIISEIEELDYYRNGKLQYVFATASNVHMIDRTGSPIPGYPKALPREAKISHLSLIDYDRTKNYRLGITDTEGKVYLSDKDLKILEGWDPIPYQRPAVKPLRHARMGSRDVMISLQEDGVINVTNRRGERQSGFPFDVQENISEGYFLNISNSLGRSSLTALTTQGELIELNFEGIVINRNQLIKQSTGTTFEMIPDRGLQSYVIARKEDGVYAILDATGNLLFEKDYLSDGEILIQYYQFGGGKDLITFTDVDAGSLFVFDRSGNLVTGNPIASTNEVGLLYSSAKKELQIYTSVGTNLEFYTFNY